LSWAGSSEKAQTFALILSDPDAPGGVFYHWILYNIPREVHELSAGVKELPVGTMVGQNSWAKTQYNGPCPPKGAIHHYLFTLYAIDTKLNLTSGADYKKVMQAMRSHILEETNFTAIYEIDNEKHS
jgi:Raf kinase inhibitor-like YbhB/YbcL family protein